MYLQIAPCPYTKKIISTQLQNYAELKSKLPLLIMKCSLSLQEIQICSLSAADEMVLEYSWGWQPHCSPSLCVPQDKRDIWTRGRQYLIPILKTFWWFFLVGKVEHTNSVLQFRSTATPRCTAITSINSPLLRHPLCILIFRDITHCTAQYLKIRTQWIVKQWTTPFNQLKWPRAIYTLWRHGRWAAPQVVFSSRRWL